MGLYSLYFPVRVLKWKERYERLYEQEMNQEAELEKLRETISSQDTDSADLSKQLEEYHTLLGLNEVTGQGLIITLKDASSSTIAGKIRLENYLVHDGDLLEVVNALKEAGSEAISINGQRIVGNTAITCAGNITLINDEKVGVPFEIKAIGLTEKLYGALTMPYGYLERMEEDGIQVEVKKSENITIPKYNGIYQFEYAQNEEEVR